jgi:glycerophosphoryl diester phosphodiesterase
MQQNTPISRFLDPGPRPRPLILGHRGASAEFPENTLLAFRQALRQGADGVELDVMRCGSGEVVVVHDDDLGRVCGGPEGSGPDVRRTPLAELRRHDVGRGERVPTLEEVCEELGSLPLLNIELKSREHRSLLGHVPDDGLAEATVQALRRVGRLHNPATTLISSFDPLQLARFLKHAQGALPIGLLFHADQAYPLRNAWPAALLHPQAVHPEAALVDAVALRGWRRLGYAVHVWTVDAPHEAAALCALGVDALITNTPGALRGLMDQTATSRASPSPGPDSPPGPSSPGA